MKKNTKVQIFCDMDGVIVDFEGGVVDYINSDLKDKSRVPENMLKDYNALQDKLNQIKKTQKINIADLTKNSEKKITAVRNYMYTRVSDDHKFWAELKWTLNGKNLWNFIKNASPQVIILTAPMPGKGCYTGKKEWVKKNLGPQYKVIIEEDKFLHSGNNKLLIDDTYSKIVPWKEKGGLIIHHKNIKDTISILKDKSYEKTI